MKTSSHVTNRSIETGSAGILGGEGIGWRSGGRCRQEGRKEGNQGGREQRKQRSTVAIWRHENNGRGG